MKTQQKKARRRATKASSLVEPLETRTLLSAAAEPVVLLQDNFNGSRVSAANWSLPTFASGGSFFGRTQQRVAENVPLSSVTVSGGAVILKDDSYNPTDTDGNLSFYGTELISNQSFAIAPTPGAGLDLQVRMKLNTSVGGVVAAAFLYNVISPTDHNEVDTELISNEVAVGTNRVEGNIYANAPFNAGSPFYGKLPSGTLTGWHTYEEQVYADHINWLVDGQMYYTENTTLPTGPLQIYLNIWTPDATWPAAYNAGIQAVATAAKNKEYTASVDSVTLTRLEPAPDTTPPSPNPETWAAKPVAISPTAITMTATTAIDPSDVEYFFHNMTVSGHDSGWQSSPTYTDAGLKSGTKYTYEVETRDDSPKENTGKYSAVASATTLPLTVSQVSISLSTTSPVQGAITNGTGSIAGNGTGSVSYYWAVQKPNSIGWQKVGADKTLAMNNGEATIGTSPTLPSATVGTYYVGVFIDSGQSKGLSSNILTYTVVPPAPGITITKVPPYGSSGFAQGKVTGVNPSQYGVVVYIHISTENVNAGGWWGPKPFWDEPISPISANGTWSVDMVTGGVDEDADMVIVFLVPKGTAGIPLLGAASSIPSYMYDYLYSEVSR